MLFSFWHSSTWTGNLKITPPIVAELTHILLSVKPTLICLDSHFSKNLKDFSDYHTKVAQTVLCSLSCDSGVSCRVESPHPTFQLPLPISFIALRAHSYRANVCFFKKQLRVYLGMRDREYEKNFLYFPFSHRVHKSYSSLKDRMYQKKTKTLEVCIPCTTIILFSFSVVLESNKIFKKIFT